MPSKGWKPYKRFFVTYEEARAHAQTLANQSGFDYGIEATCFPSKRKTPTGYRVFGLPAKRNRYGYELHCEVVMCENLSRCQKGHGPNG